MKSLDESQRLKARPNVARLLACHLGRLEYREGLALQESLVRVRAEGGCEDLLLFPDHPPVLTIGRGAGEGNLRVSQATLTAMGIEVFEVARGGDITWHGPGQLVGYTVVRLDEDHRDLHAFLRALESGLIDALGRFGIKGSARPGKTGVWVGDLKIASIGIAVRRWVTYHGFALNVSPDLGHFDLIHPCGLRGVRMTSIATLLGRAAPSIESVREFVAASVAERLGRRLAWIEAEEAQRLASELSDATEPKWAAGGAR